MTRQVIYRYLGTNGIIESPVHLEDVYYVRLLRLTADKGKVLTNGAVEVEHVQIPEEDEPLWKEIKAKA